MIKKSLCFLYRCFECPIAIATGLILISLLALGGALVSEVFLGLEPCELCIYQRWPFVFTLFIGLFILIRRGNKQISLPLIALGGLAFLVNGIIATYHSGVEQKWWVSAVDGCSVPAGFIDNDQSWIENLMSTPAGRCDEIPWQDPFIGLSMANYNMILCFGLFIACIYAVMRLKRAPL